MRGSDFLSFDNIYGDPMNRFPQHEITRGVNVYSKGGITHTPCTSRDATDTTMPKLIEALGGQSVFDALPLLDLDACTAYGGGTGYIDFVRASDMPSSVMRGEDEHGRPFVSFRIETRRREAPYVETLFRRYKTGPVWTSGGGSEICPGTVDAGVLAMIADLVAEGAAERERRVGDPAVITLSDAE